MHVIFPNKINLLGITCSLYRELSCVWRYGHFLVFSVVQYLNSHLHVGCLQEASWCQA